MHISNYYELLFELEATEIWLETIVTSGSCFIDITLKILFVNK